MKSKTKTSITPEQIRRLAARHFPGMEVTAVRELTEGMFNAAYLLEGTGLLKDGIVLKAGPMPETKVLTYEREIMRAEVEVYRLLEDKPIPTPGVLAEDFSRRDIPCDYFFMEMLSGSTWKEREKEITKQSRAVLMKELGACQAAVHSVEGGWFGYIKEEKRFRFDSWSAAFAAMVEDILEDGRAGGHKLPYAAVTETVKRHENILNKVKTPQLVDYDMWAGNVFLKEEDGFHISGIVDFERSFYGDPYADFTSSVMLFEDVEKEPEFCAGYREAGGRQITVGEEERIRMALYRLYLSLIMSVETYRYDKAYAATMKGYMKKNINGLLKKLQ